MSENETNPQPQQTPFDSIGQSPPGAAPAAGAPTAPAPAPKKKKKRWWLRIILVLLVLIVLLVALAPYIAGTAPVRSIVVSQINNNLNGSVEIADYSVGWTGGISASGIKVFDAQKNLVLEVPKFVTKLSLIGAAKGNLDLGDTQIDVRLNDVRIDKDGSLNLAELAKSQPAGEHKAKEPKPKAPGPMDVPSVKGKVTVNILGGKVSGEAVPQPVSIEPGSIVLDIPNINEPIQNAIKLAYRVGEGTTSEIDLAGQIDVGIKNGKLDVDKIVDVLKADQKLGLVNVNLAAAEPFVKPSLGPEGQLGGVAAGDLAISAEGITGISANGEITVANALLAATGLKDIIKIEKISVPIEVTRTVKDASTTIIDIKTLKVVTPLSIVDVTGQFQEQTLDRLAKNEPPGADGHIVIAHSIPDMGAVARALPNTLKLAEGVEVQSGSLNDTATITFATDRITLAQTSDVSAKGTQNGRPIELKPVHLEVGAVALPSGKPVPNVKDLKLALNSSFATISGGGESLAKVDIKGDFDLAKLRSEVAQFSDLGELQLAGTGSFSVNNTGDPTDTTQPIVASVTASLNNVVVSGIGPATKEHPIEQPRLALAASAKLERDAAGAISGVEESTVSLQTGDANAPLVDIAATANNVGLKAPFTVGSFKVSKMNVNDLAAVQRQFGAFIPALKDQKIEVKSGSIYVNVAGTFADGKTLQFTEPLAVSIGNVGLTKEGRTILDKETIRGGINGKVTLDGSNMAANLTDFGFTSASNLFSINKMPDSPIDVKVAGGGITGNGAIGIAADLKRLNDIAQAFGGEVTATSRAGQVQSGKFGGTLKLSHPDNDTKTSINFDGAVANLTVTTNQKPIQNETIEIKLAAVSPDDLSGVDVSQAGISSKFITANVTDTKLKLGGVWDLVQKAAVEVDVPDLPVLLAIAQAFSPPPAPAPVSAIQDDSSHPLMMQAAPNDRRNRNPPPAPAAADATPKPLDPMELTKGSATLKLNVTRDTAQQTTTVDLSEIKLTGLALRRGQQSYVFKSDVNLKLNAAVKAADDPKKSIAEQLQSIEVRSLDGDLGGIARLSMPKPLLASGLADMNNLLASGQIQLDGKLADEEARLLAVLGGQAPPCRIGDYSLVQTIASKPGGAVSLDGSIIANNFQVLDEAGKVAFTEPRVSIKNDLDADVAKKVAVVKTLSVDMPQSQAVSLNVAARVKDWEQNRAISDADGNGPARIELTYDLAKIWPIIHPMMVTPGQEDSFKDLKIGGKYTKTINVSGKYPAGRPFNEAIKYVKADGGLTVGLLDWTGLNIKELSPTVTLDGGIARLDGKGICNEGGIDLTGITADLRQPTPLISVPNNTHLLKDVKLNPVLMNSLGKFASVIFGNAERAEGKLNVIVKRYDKVPLGALINKSNKAQAEVVFNVAAMHLDGAGPKVLATICDLGTEGIYGSVPDSTVKLSNGEVQTDVTILIGKSAKEKSTGRESVEGQPLRLHGGVGLAKLDLRNYVVEVPPGLIVRDLRKGLPNGLTVPFKGTLLDYKLDAEKAIQENLKKNLIPGLLGGGDKGKGGEKSGEDPIGDILKGLGKKKK